VTAAFDLATGYRGFVQRIRSEGCGLLSGRKGGENCGTSCHDSAQPALDQVLIDHSGRQPDSGQWQPGPPCASDLRSRSAQLLGQRRLGLYEFHPAVEATGIAWSGSASLHPGFIGQSRALGLAPFLQAAISSVAMWIGEAVRVDCALPGGQQRCTAAGLPQAVVEARPPELSQAFQARIFCGWRPVAMASKLAPSAHHPVRCAVAPIVPPGQRSEGRSGGAQFRDSRRQRLSSGWLLLRILEGGQAQHGIPDSSRFVVQARPSRSCWVEGLLDRRQNPVNRAGARPGSGPGRFECTPDLSEKSWISWEARWGLARRSGARAMG